MSRSLDYTTEATHSKIRKGSFWFLYDASDAEPVKVISVRNNKIVLSTNPFSMGNNKGFVASFTKKQFLRHFKKTSSEEAAISYLRFDR
jgi:hypothetical protein